MDNELNGNFYLRMERGGGRRVTTALRDLLDRLNELDGRVESATNTILLDEYITPITFDADTHPVRFYWDSNDCSASTEFLFNYMPNNKQSLDKKLSKLNNESNRRHSKSNLNCEFMSTKQEIKASRIKEVLEQNKKLKALREKRREEADKRVAREFFDGLEVVGEESDVV